MKGFNHIYDRPIKIKKVLPRHPQRTVDFVIALWLRERNCRVVSEMLDQSIANVHRWVRNYKKKNTELAKGKCLPVDLVANVFKLFNDGKTRREIEAMLNVPYTTVRYIIYVYGKKRPSKS